MKFQGLNISDEIKKAVKDLGYEEATPIQEKSIPAIMEGKDVIGFSQTEVERLLHLEYRR